MRLLFSLVRADQFGLGENMSSHCVFDFLFGCLRWQAQPRVERHQFEMVMVNPVSARWTRPAPADPPEIIHTLPGSAHGRNRIRLGYALGNLCRGGGNSVQDPMRERTDGCIRIVADQREATGALRRALPR